MSMSITNEPTEAQVKAAAKALRADEGFMEVVHSTREVSWSEYIARLVLVAAQGAAPPVGRRPQRLLNQLNRIADALEEYVFEGVAADAPAWMRKAAEYIESERQWRAPVPPSSGVDKDKLAEVKARALEEAANDLRVSFSRGAAIAMHHQCHKKQCRCGNPGNDEIVREVFEAAREELRARAEAYKEGKLT